MHWNNQPLVDPVVHDQKWKRAVKPNFATLLAAVLVIILTAVYRPVLLLAVIPLFILIGIIWYRLAEWALKEMTDESAGEP